MKNNYPINKEITSMTSLPKIALGAWARGNDGTFGNSLTANGLNLWDAAYAYGIRRWPDEVLS